MKDTHQPASPEPTKQEADDCLERQRRRLAESLAVLVVRQDRLRSERASAEHGSPEDGRHA